MSDGARPTRVAPLPRYSPSVLVMRVQELLVREGITVVVDLGNTGTAVLAAADLLRALGVAPGLAPVRGGH
jgi:adenine/guanine phosphoribosyltransferase-like PRPP-binding protein